MAKSRPKPLLIWLLILQIILCFVIYFICACIRRRRQRRHHFSRTTTAFGPWPGLYGPKQDDALSRGLDPALVDSFPVIPCSALKDVKPGCGPELARLECAVCLSSFHEDQTLRFIPNCQHVFHPVCVDPWFRLHSTCPYCRANLEGPAPRIPFGFNSGPGHGDAPDSIVIVVVTGASKDYGDERYTLRLSDEVWREIMPEDKCQSDDHPIVLAGERCPPMGRRGGCDDGDQETPSVPESD